MEALTLFLWGENLEKHARVFGRSGWLKNAWVLYRFWACRVKILFKLALGVGD
ncbi:hypothetical protein MPG35_06755 [Helicobacter pylori]|uniref:hypothetical protein n=1 Tax=Helicobacter pylori TaxID=210 RepID=UPI001FD3D4E5|nr:hypothetical protein [Helicobacter pylori]UOS28439.1 hypothetical protein MPG35_06755 [Helicobacter pylori]